MTKDPVDLARGFFVATLMLTPSLPALQLTLVPFTLAMASVAATSYALRCREHGTGRLCTVLRMTLLNIYPHHPPAHQGETGQGREDQTSRIDIA